MKKEVLFALSLLSDLKERDFITQEGYDIVLHELFQDCLDKVKQDLELIDVLQTINKLLNENN